jgi:hypothetical protein
VESHSAAVLAGNWLSLRSAVHVVTNKRFMSFVLVVRGTCCTVLCSITVVCPPDGQRILVPFLTSSQPCCSVTHLPLINTSPFGHIGCGHWPFLSGCAPLGHVGGPGGGDGHLPLLSGVEPSGHFVGGGVDGGVVGGGGLPLGGGLLGGGLLLSPDDGGLLLSDDCVLSRLVGCVLSLLVSVCRWWFEAITISTLTFIVSNNITIGMVTKSSVFISLLSSQPYR